ncbi:hypothetical protein PFISCL1PPCAC_17241 [Pristionchus fissidentatus]|uniref:Uncharacterized protein n=1 Tax=Pristionchus fissidentatus TaxID=1538716 RepID=A0AAV5W7U9_9BILA|nr:hypothetical protein PFISCL1PPCAC_17241 [Pristionchus fissidentatus]
MNSVMGSNLPALVGQLCRHKHRSRRAQWLESHREKAIVDTHERVSIAIERRLVVHLGHRQFDSVENKEKIDGRIENVDEVRMLLNEE